MQSEYWAECMSWLLVVQQLTHKSGEETGTGWNRGGIIKGRIQLGREREPQQPRQNATTTRLSA